jgi:hypothetical protein
MTLHEKDMAKPLNGKMSIDISCQFNLENEKVKRITPGNIKLDRADFSSFFVNFDCWPAKKVQKLKKSKSA